MRRLAIALVVLLVATAAFARRNKQADWQATEAGAVLKKYLDLRYRGAEWDDFAQYVLWEKDQEPACFFPVRSYEVTELRVRDKETALATVVFHRLGEYCPDDITFTPQPALEKAVYQLRKKSIVWMVEKSNRPGGNVDWKIVRNELRDRLLDRNVPVDETAKLAAALDQLEKAANAIGRTPSGKQ